MHRLLLSILAAVLFITSAAHAGGGLLSGQRFDVTIRDQDVREVLDELSVVIGIPVAKSEQVSGRVSAAFDNATAVELLDRIARDRGLDWRYDGRRIVVTSKSEQITRILSMNGVMLSDLVTALDTLGVREDQFPISAIDGEIAMIVAPPGYLALVEVVLGELIKRSDADRAAAASALEQQRVNEEHLRALQRERDALERERRAHTRRGPMIVRNGVWGG